MKRKLLLLFIPVLLFTVALTAQTVSFGYDDAGNRISRTIVLNSAPAYAPPQSGDVEEISPFVEQVSDDLQVKIYPNPTQGLLNVEIVGLDNADDAAQIAVFAQSGQQLLSVTASGTLSPVDLSAFPSGIYILRLTVRGKPVSYSIIKK